MNERSLLKQSKAHKIIEADRAKGKLSHAYLVICADQSLLRLYLKYLAALILGAEENSRADRLILNETYSDCLVYPQVDKNIVVATVEEIVGLSIIKPVESDKKLFVLSDCQNMNEAAQNKLLKTLEEPPKNVIMLLGTTKEQSILPTVLSRSKKIEIQPFSERDILKVLQAKIESLENGEMIAAASGGSLGYALDMASSGTFERVFKLCLSSINSLKSVTDILAVSEMLFEEAKNIKLILSLLKIIYRDMLFQKSGQSALIINKAHLADITMWAAQYDIGALLWAAEKISESEKNISFNANTNMVIESLLLSIMEGKHKWQKL